MPRDQQTFLLGNPICKKANPSLPCCRSCRYGNSVYEFDQYKILEVLLQMLDDSKERIRFTALEAIVAFVSIGNKLSAQEIIY